MDCSTPGFPVLHHLLEFPQTLSIDLVMPSNHCILCCPLLLLPSIFPSIRVLSSHSALRDSLLIPTCPCVYRRRFCCGFFSSCKSRASRWMKWTRMVTALFMWPHSMATSGAYRYTAPLPGERRATSSKTESGNLVPSEKV